MPFPSEETTPPVTKMYLAIFKKIPLGDKLINAVEVFGCVNAERLVLCFYNPYAVAILKSPQLLQRFSRLKWSDGHCGIAKQEVLAIDVEPDVFEIRFVDAAVVWDRTSREVNRIA